MFNDNKSISLSKILHSHTYNIEVHQLSIDSNTRSKTQIKEISFYLHFSASYSFSIHSKYIISFFCIQSYNFFIKLSSHIFLFNFLLMLINS